MQHNGSLRRELRTTGFKCCLCDSLKIFHLFVLAGRVLSVGGWRWDWIKCTTPEQIISLPSPKPTSWPFQTFQLTKVLNKMLSWLSCNNVFFEQPKRFNEMHRHLSRLGSGGYKSGLKDNLIFLSLAHQPITSVCSLMNTIITTHGHKQTLQQFYCLMPFFAWNIYHYPKTMSGFLHHRLLRKLTLGISILQKMDRYTWRVLTFSRMSVKTVA